MKYSVIIPFYSHTIEETVRQAERRDDTEIIAVITGHKALNLTSKVLKIIKCDKCGYGAAVNRGAKHSEGGSLIIMNDDVILDNSFFEILDTINADAIVPTVYNFNTGEIESTHSSLDFLWYNKLKKEPPKHKNSHIPGSIFIIKKRLLFDCGAFDEDYFMYYEDVDLSLRIEKMAAVHYSERLKSSHKQSFSDFKRKKYYLQKNRLLFIVKNCKKNMLPLFFFYFMTFEMIIMTYQCIISKSLEPIRARWGFLKECRRFMEKRDADSN
ncbi:TPA: hypothetical protein DCW38_08035 [candidate division WOR-3 bacterium]|jgi:GT2 family glycosyltransferase|uniref:Glycosyltransferase 2-like domain-containing protein n=1 Tax=candidate division WOR-3 bacterium TaxID=2052148 RepID=A0A350HC45_UNCW3|nr:hypothetical protein [candidate division WOR-3 bacterium]